MATKPNEHFTYEPNNEEEAEIAQLSNLFETEALVRAARDRIREQQSRPSLEECSDCGEPIPPARQRAVPGVQLCIDCAELADRRR
jgi:phage/conjugal plasmid C-4 type zinc finger TraR family protein